MLQPKAKIVLFIEPAERMKFRKADEMCWLTIIPLIFTQFNDFMALVFQLKHDFCTLKNLHAMDLAADTLEISFISCALWFSCLLSSISTNVRKLMDFTNAKTSIWIISKGNFAMWTSWPKHFGLGFSEIKWAIFLRCHKRWPTIL